MPKLPAFPLFYRRGLPRAVDMMEGHNLILNIRPFSQFICTSNNNPLSAAAHIGKHLIPLFICFGVVNEADLFFRNPF